MRALSPVRFAPGEQCQRFRTRMLERFSAILTMGVSFLLASSPACWAVTQLVSRGAPDQRHSALGHSALGKCAQKKPPQAVQVPGRP